MTCPDTCPTCDELEEDPLHEWFDAWWTARYPNLGKRWTDDELLKLAEMRAAGVPMEVREQYFGRTSAAISCAIQRHLFPLPKEMQ